MDRLLKAILDYAQTAHTDYAILLTGKWGSGKTHYWKNIISPALAKASVPNSNDQFKPLYVSLYGLSETREIESRILFELLPFFKRQKNKKGKLESITTLSRNIIGAASNTFLKLDFDKLFNGVSLKSFYSLDNAKYFLCFDDFERVDPALGVNKVLGFINSYIEHDRVKTLIITNEEPIIENDQDYKRLKEKVVGRTLTFEQHDKTNVQNILSEYENIKAVRTKFDGVEDLLMRVFKIGGNGNLRSLRFSFDVLNKVFQAGNSIIYDEKCDHNIIKIVTILVLAVSFEFKKGKIIGQEDLEKLSPNEIAKFTARFFENQNKQTNDEPFHLFNMLRKEYFEPFDVDFVNLDSISDYILFGFLDEQKLAHELKLLIYGNSEPHQESLTRIRQFRTLEQDVFDRTIAEIKKYLMDNKYRLSEILNLADVFLFLCENNLLDDDVESLSRSFSDAMEAKHQVDDFEARLEEYFPSLANRPYQTQISKLIEKATEINGILKQRHEKKAIDNFISMMKRNTDGLFKTLVALEERYDSKPILKDFPVEPFYEIIINSNNEQLKYFNTFFNNRYKHFSNYLSGEKEFLEELSSKLDRYIDEHRKAKIDVVLFNIIRLNLQFKEIVKSLSNNASDSIS